MNGLFNWWKARRQNARIESEIDRIKDEMGVEDRDFEKGRPVYGLAVEWQSPDWWARLRGSGK